jgi:Fe-S cluster assembly scaffold protein SufB
VVTIDGVLATLAATMGDDLISIGRAVDHAEGADLLGTVLDDPRDFPLLNDAFAIDPVVVDVQAGAQVPDPVVIVHVVSGAAGTAVFPRTVVRTGIGATAGVIEIVVDADTALLADGSADWTAGVDGPAERLVVPVTELRVGDDASLAYLSIQSLGSATWQLAHQASTIGARASLSS